MWPIIQRTNTYVATEYPAQECTNVLTAAFNLSGSTSPNSLREKICNYDTCSWPQSVCVYVECVCRWLPYMATRTLLASSCMVYILYTLNLLQLSLISVNPCMLHADEKYWVAFTKLFGGSALIIILLYWCTFDLSINHLVSRYTTWDRWRKSISQNLMHEIYSLIFNHHRTKWPSYQ